MMTLGMATSSRATTTKMAIRPVSRSRMKSTAFLALLAAVLGCGSDDGLGDIRGVARTRHITARGEEVVARDLTGIPIAAHVFDAEGERIFPGIGYGDGTFEVPGVPRGEYLLRIGDLTTVETDPEPSRTFSVLGRADARVATRSDTALQFDVGNLDAWHSLDRVQLFSDGSGTDLSVSSSVLDPSLTDGATALRTTMSYAGLTGPSSAAPLVDATKGDVAYLGQYHRAVSGRDESTRLVRVLRVDGLVQEDGTAQTIAGTLSEPAASTLELAVDGGAFVASGALIHPTAALDYLSVGVAAVPGWRDLGAYPPGFLLSYNLFANVPDELAVGVGTASPYADDDTYVWVLASFRVSVEYEGLSARLTESIVLRGGLQLGGAGTPLAPAILPPADLVVGDQPSRAGGTLSAAGTRLTWTPTVATDVRYVVQVIRIDAVEFEPLSLTWTGTVQTSGAHIDIPTQMISEPGAYVFELTAIEAEGLASTVSGVFVKR